MCPFLLSSTLSAFAQTGMLVLVLAASLQLPGYQPKLIAACLPLTTIPTVVFSFNYFFQYVKELLLMLLAYR